MVRVRMKTTYSARIVGIAIFVTVLSLGFITYKSFSPSVSPLLISPLSSPQSLSPLVQLDVPLEPQPTVLPTPILAYPTAEDAVIVVTAPPMPEPVYTEVPFPTLYPTPVVTPIPTIAPPYIEGIDALPLQPFWIYWSEGDEVWRIDSEGNAPELVVNAFASTGQHIAGPPKDASDCCVLGPPFVVSPDHRKVALVTLDPSLIDPMQKMSPENYALTIQIYDRNLNTAQSLGGGVLPIWSPDSKQVAFLRDAGLWIGNATTGEVAERVPGQEDGYVRVADYTWSPDSSRLAYMMALGAFTWVPTIWVLNLVDGREPKVVFDLDDGESDISIFGIRWSPDGDSIYYLSHGEQGGLYLHNQVQNLWRVSVADGATQRVTNDMVVAAYGFLLGQPWLYVSAIRLFEKLPDDNFVYHLWLVNGNDGTLRRLTDGKEDLLAFDHTPEGTYLLSTDDTGQPQLFSLSDGSVTPLDERIGETYYYGGAK